MKGICFVVAMVAFCGALLPLVAVVRAGERFSGEKQWVSYAGIPHRVTDVQARLDAGDIIRLSDGRLSSVESIDGAGDLVVVVVHSGSWICDTMTYSFEQLEREGAYPIYHSDFRYREAKKKIDAYRCAFSEQ